MPGAVPLLSEALRLRFAATRLARARQHCTLFEGGAGALYADHARARCGLWDTHSRVPNQIRA